MSPPRSSLILIGFTAVIAQVVLMRELVVVFYGNEICFGLILASWLLWTALGSGLLGRLAAHTYGPRRLMAALQCVVALVFPLTILCLRAAKGIFHPIPGEILGPWPMFVTSVLVLSVFCPASGLLFAAGSHAYARAAGVSTGEASSSVYLLEAVGSGFGGLLASLALIRYLDAFQIALLLSLLNLFAASSLAWRSSRRARMVTVTLFALAAVPGVPALSRRLDRASLAWLWRGFGLVATRNSIYGNLTLVDTEGSRSLYENGLVISTVPDPASAEEAVHLALLEHPAPSNLLLIGGGLDGSVAQALQHRTLQQIDYVELDPAMFELAREYLPSVWTAIGSDPRVHIHHIDGRLFLKTTSEKYDVIIVNLPDPQTAQLNRFYTVEFFREAAFKLAAGGVFSFQLRSAEDYISPELADFLRCIRKTLGEVFPFVTFIPGSAVHFFAAERSGVLAAGAGELLARMRSRQLQTRYVREYYLPFRMSSDRMLDLDLEARPQAGTAVNRDFTPIAYYFDVALWSKRFAPGYRHFLQSMAGVRFGRLAAGTAAAMILLALMLGWLPRGQSRARAAAGLCVAATGFTLMGLELLLLLGFQAIYGYVYSRLAIVIAALMVGMALGSWRALSSAHNHATANERATPSPPKRESRSVMAPEFALGRIQILTALAPLTLCVFLVWFGCIANPAQLFVVGEIVFPALALGGGVLGGYQFPIVSRAFFSGPEPGGAGTLYALDLAGACVGAIVLSTYLVPVFGFLRTALLTALVNLPPAGLALWINRRLPIRSQP
ncbi:MAG TPA: fused MFS/spermidine synthase [Terriglobia bacterium]|nr:fused MFS/spermidine synthase [Terriglobia bacterium]